MLKPLPVILCIALTGLFSTPIEAQKRESGNLVLDGLPELPADLIEQLDRYQNTRSASLADWDPRGGLYIGTRFGEVVQIHHVAAPGGMREQVTFFREPVTGAQVCPDPVRNGFSYVRDAGGNENFQIYYYDRNNGASTLLSDGKSRHSGALWSHKGDRFAYSSNRRNGRDGDIYVASLADPGQAKMVYEANGSWSAQDWSPDESQLIVGRNVSVRESYLYLLDMASGKTEQINPVKKQIAYGRARFTPDGKGIYLISDEDSEFASLRYYDLATRTFSAVTPGISWDVETFDLSKDGRSLVFTVNEGGFTALYFMDTRSSKFKKVEGLPKGVVGGLKFHADGRQVAMSINTSSTPSDVFVWDSKKGTFTRWTFSEVGGLNPATFITPEIVQYPTFDSVNGKPRMIPALLYKPKTATGKFPVVISIHGGPEGQSLPTFNPFFQYLLNEKGIALLVPNVRGSTGYGKTYVSLDDAYLRENSVKDIGTLLDWIGKQSDLDPGRVMVYGGSYGGYMTLACMTHFNDRLKGGIDLFGISNWVTFLENTSGYRQDLRRVEYGDERDPKMRAFLTEISPIQHIGNITKPMFIFQGKNDPRVPLSESEQMVQALKDRDLSIWYIMAKDEGHGLSKKANRDMVNAAMVLFMTNLL